MTFILPVLLLLLLSGASAKVVTTFENQCDTFFAVKQPPIITPKPAFKNICQTLNGVVYYATLYDTSKKIPVYSAYKFEGVKNCDRPNKPWYIEPQLDNNNAGADMALQCTKDVTCGRKQALNANYVQSGYDKGHLAPVYQASSQLCAQATFTLTNAAPQNPSFNKGQWRKTEKDIANILNKDCKENTKYIVTGVVPGGETMKNTDVTVPSHFWTAYCCLDNNDKCAFSQGYIGVNKNDRLEEMNVSDLEKRLKTLYEFESFQLFASSTKTRKRMRS